MTNVYAISHHFLAVPPPREREAGGRAAERRGELEPEDVVAEDAARLREDAVLDGVRLDRRAAGEEGLEHHLESPTD